MPIYEYCCERGHSFECMQRMGADAIEACTVCGAPAMRVFSAPAVHFKGSGFYATDYGKKGRGAASDNGGDGGDGGGDKKDKKDTKETKDTKTESKTAASSSGSDSSSSSSCSSE